MALDADGAEIMMKLCCVDGVDHGCPVIIAKIHCCVRGDADGAAIIRLMRCVDGTYADGAVIVVPMRCGDGADAYDAVISDCAVVSPGHVGHGHHGLQLIWS